jgi:hypothetical protein
MGSGISESDRLRTAQATGMVRLYATVSSPDGARDIWSVLDRSPSPPKGRHSIINTGLEGLMCIVGH